MSSEEIDIVNEKMKSSRQEFSELCEVAQNCVRCPSLADKLAVVGPQCGQLSARLMFIAEAPGRFGADKTRVPLQDDRTEDFLLLGKLLSVQPG